jgi:hypothetical protein
MSKQAETHSQSPEELLRHLETETMRKRSLREGLARQRLGLVGGGLLLVIGGAMAALFFLFSMLRDLPHGERMKSGDENIPVAETP